MTDVKFMTDNALEESSATHNAFASGVPLNFTSDTGPFIPMMVTVPSGIESLYDPDTDVRRVEFAAENCPPVLSASQ